MLENTELHMNYILELHMKVEECQGILEGEEDIDHRSNTPNFYNHGIHVIIV